MHFESLLFHFEEKPKQKIFAHTSDFVLFSQVHTAFSFEQGGILMRFRLVYPMKVPENADESNIKESFIFCGRFQNPPLSPVHRAFSINVFRRFNVDDIGENAWKSSRF